MPIIAPEVRLSSTEKELLHLLAALVTETPLGRCRNAPLGQALLSDSEAQRLLVLLEELASSRKFIESSFFVEQITKGSRRPDETLREIYLSWRNRYGRSRALSSAKWRDFLSRLGVERYPPAHVVGTSFEVGREMPIAYFERMERAMVSQPGISRRVQSLILNVITEHADDVDKARHGERQLPQGSIRNLPKRMIDVILDKSPSVDDGFSIPSAQVAGLMTTLVDMSVLFTTRDWGVAGTMSTIAGGFAAATRS